MRKALALFLALIVALAGVTMADARHHPQVAGVAVLCIGGGEEVLALDSQGNPVGPVLPCPDCIPPAHGADPVAAPLPGTPLRLAMRVRIPRGRVAPTPPAPGFHWSRGPPARV